VNRTQLVPVEFHNASCELFRKFAGEEMENLGETASVDPAIFVLLTFAKP